MKLANPFTLIRYHPVSLGSVLVLVCLIVLSLHFGVKWMKHSSESISILSWWGYIEPDRLQSLSKQCNTKIELTETYSADDFLAAFEARQPFDISIYPRDLHPSYKAAFPEPGPDISDIAAGYYPSIRSRYHTQAFSTDTLYFQHAVTLLVYDQDRIPDIDTITLDEMLSLAQEGRMVLPNSFELINWLLEQDKSVDVAKRWQQIYDLVADQHIQLSDYATALYGTDLMLAYQVSGEVLNPNIQWSKVLGKGGQTITPKYRVHPDYSYIASDILSIQSHHPAAVCVARQISSQPFLQHTSNSSYYYSPFGDLPQIENAGALTAIGQDFLENVEFLPWLPPRNREEYSSAARKIWQDIQGRL